MLRKWLAALVVPVFILVAPTVRAQEAPTVVVRVKSLNALLQNLNLVVKLVGQEEKANEIEGLIKSNIGKNGLKGIDTTRPFGAYVRFGKNLDEINGAILVPMRDESTFLDLLDSLNIEVTKDKNAIYTHKTGKGFDLYFRFANQYLYITSVNTESIQAKNLIDPAKALAMKGDATIAVVARIDQIPDIAKGFALSGGWRRRSIRSGRKRSRTRPSYRRSSASPCWENSASSGPRSSEMRPSCASISTSATPPRK